MSRKAAPSTLAPPPAPRLSCAGARAAIAAIVVEESAGVRAEAGRILTWAIEDIIGDAFCARDAARVAKVERIREAKRAIEDAGAARRSTVDGERAVWAARAEAESLGEEVAEGKKEIEKLGMEVEERKKEVEMIEIGKGEEIGRMERQIMKAEGRVIEAKGEVREVKGELKEAKAEVREGKAEIARLKKAALAREKEDAKALKVAEDRGAKEVREAAKEATKRAAGVAADLEAAKKEVAALQSSAEGAEKQLTAALERADAQTGAQKSLKAELLTSRKQVAALNKSVEEAKARATKAEVRATKAEARPAAAPAPKRLRGNGLGIGNTFSPAPLVYDKAIGRPVAHRRREDTSESASQFGTPQDPIDGVPSDAGVLKKGSLADIQRRLAYAGVPGGSVTVTPVKTAVPLANKRPRAIAKAAAAKKIDGGKDFLSESDSDSDFGYKTKEKEKATRDAGGPSNAADSSPAKKSVTALESARTALASARIEREKPANRKSGPGKSQSQASFAKPPASKKGAASKAVKKVAVSKAAANALKASKAKVAKKRKRAVVPEPDSPAVEAGAKFRKNKRRKKAGEKDEKEVVGVAEAAPASRVRRPSRSRRRVSYDYSIHGGRGDVTFEMTKAKY